MPTPPRFVPTADIFSSRKPSRDAFLQASGGAPKSHGIGGVPTLKTFGVLEAVVGSEKPLSVAELGLIAGVPKPTMHRIVRMLETEGLLQREVGQRRYGPGPRLFSFATSVSRASMRTAPRHAVLEWLGAETGETCVLGMMINTQVAYLDRVESPWPLGLRYAPGRRIPVHCTAIGKLLMAHMPRARRDQLLATLHLDRFTERTITTSGQLASALDHIRNQGYAIDDQEFLDGVVGVAVPVRSGAAVVAGIGIAAPVARMSVDLAIGHVPRLQLASERLAATLGPCADEGAGA